MFTTLCEQCVRLIGGNMAICTHTAGLIGVVLLIVAGMHEARAVGRKN
jgi:hypothetical protein